MDKEIVKNVSELVKDAISNASEGREHLANIGIILNTKGINYKNLGFLKLKELFEDPDLQPFFILEKDDSTPPVYFIKLRKYSSNDRRNSTLSRSDKRGNTSPVLTIKGNELNQWAYFPDFPAAIRDLKNLALNETWYYTRQKADYPNPILSNYLKYTYVRLVYEKKIKEVNEYAAFNTGLVNALYDPIFALFEKNQNEGRQPWFFKKFCVPGQDWAGKILSAHFNPLPEKAKYFESAGDYIYDGHQKPQMDWEHIILENVNRLPIDFLLENKPNNFIFLDTQKMNEDEKKIYYRNLADAIKADQKIYRTIKMRIENALETSIKRANWNYKTAIPMYYPTLNTTSLLLPLALLDENVIDVALVIEKQPSGNYIGQTILPLEWAYSNARLITRPDSDWLITEHIQETGVNIDE